MMINHHAPDLGRRIRDEGRIDGQYELGRRVVLEFGERRFGRATVPIYAQLYELGLADLIATIDRVLDAESWDDLLAPAEADPSIPMDCSA